MSTTPEDNSVVDLAKVEAALSDRYGVMLATESDGHGKAVFTVLNGIAPEDLIGAQAMLKELGMDGTIKLFDGPVTIQPHVPVDHSSIPKPRLT